PHTPVLRGRGRPACAGVRSDSMEPFARTIDAAKKYVVSSTLGRVDWNAELLRGDLGKAVQQLANTSRKEMTGEETPAKSEKQIPHPCSRQPYARLPRASARPGSG